MCEMARRGHTRKGTGCGWFASDATKGRGKGFRLLLQQSLSLAEGPQCLVMLSFLFARLTSIAEVKQRQTWLVLPALSKGRQPGQHRSPVQTVRRSVNLLPLEPGRVVSVDRAEGTIPARPAARPRRSLWGPLPCLHAWKWVLATFSF